MSVMLITKEQIQKMRDAGLTLEVIARAAGITKQRVDQIIKGNNHYPSKQLYERKRNERRRNERNALKEATNG